MDKTLFVVSGFMRTGTSMMMKALEAGGLSAEYSQERDKMKDRLADEHYDPNIGGLYELDKEEYLKPYFPRGYEGKLVKALNKAVFSMDTMPEGIKVVFMRRDREEIRQSYNAFFDRNIDLTPDFDNKMESFVRRIENRKDVKSCHVFWYRDVVASPRQYFERLKSSNWPIDVEKCAEVVNGKHTRFKKEELDIGVL